MRTLGVIFILLFILGASGASVAEEKNGVLVVDRFSEGANKEGLPN